MAPLDCRPQRLLTLLQVTTSAGEQLQPPVDPAVVADCLDREGLREQVLAPHVRPLTPTMRVAGFAATVHCIEVDAVPASRDDWYRNELASVDALEPGDVIVVSTCRGSFWGELLATASAAAARAGSSPTRTRGTR